MKEESTEDLPGVQESTCVEQPATVYQNYRECMVDRTGELLEQAVEVARTFPRVGRALLCDPRDDTAALVIITDSSVRAIDPAIFDQYRIRPLRRKGTAAVSRLESLINLANRHADEDGLEAALFVTEPTLAGTGGGITAIIDYHTTDRDPNNCAHKIVYPFPLSPEWKAWMGQNGETFSMIEFADFLEDRIVDVMDPSAAETLPLEAKDYIGKAGGKLGSPSKLIEISRSLTIHENSRVVSANKLASGEGQIVFQTEHTDAAGQPVDVPGLFIIAIPVFANSPVVWRMIVRLRYRKTAGITFSYEAWRPDLVLKAAVDEAVEQARENTGLPVFYGTPES